MLFFINLTSASYTDYFNVTTTRGIELTCLLSLLGALIVANLLVYFLKKDKFNLSIKISIYTLIAFALSIIIANIVMDVKDGTFSEMDCSGYIETVPFLTLTTIITIVMTIALVITPFIIDRKKSDNTINPTKAIAYAGICLALAFGLSYIRIFDAPYGGSITLASLLPIALYSYIFGAKKGVIVSIAYSLLQFIQAPYFYHILQFFLDYIIPFGFMGVCGAMFKNIIKKPNLALTAGIGVGIVIRFISHLISGAVFFGIWMPESFTNIWAYSFVYNISYVLPDGIIAAVAGFALLSNKLFLNQLNMMTVSKKEIIEKEAINTETKSESI